MTIYDLIVPRGLLVKQVPPLKVLKTAWVRKFDRRQLGTRKFVLHGVFNFFRLDKKAKYDYRYEKPIFRPLDPRHSPADIF